MRIVKYTSRFKRDYRREKSGQHGKKLDSLFMEIVDMLAADEPLPRRAFDHPLTGERRDHRHCHIRPDLALIYRSSSEKSVSSYIGRNPLATQIDITSDVLYIHFDAYICSA